MKINIFKIPNGTFDNPTTWTLALPDGVGGHGTLSGTINIPDNDIPAAVRAAPSNFKYYVDRGTWGTFDAGHPPLETLSDRWDHCPRCDRDYRPLTKAGQDVTHRDGSCWPCWDKAHDCCYGPGRNDYQYR